MKKGIVLKLAMFVAAFAISTFAPSMTAAAASYDDEFVALINQKRAANGLQPVSLNSTLDNAAETRAEVLTEKFSYQRPDGRREFTVLDGNNIADNFVGECYSAGQATPKEALDNMMQYDFFEKKSRAKTLRQLALVTTTVVSMAITGTFFLQPRQQQIEQNSHRKYLIS